MTHSQTLRHTSVLCLIWEIHARRSTFSSASARRIIKNCFIVKTAYLTETCNICCHFSQNNSLKNTGTSKPNMRDKCWVIKFSSASTRKIIKTFSLSRQITSQRQVTNVAILARITHSQTLGHLSLIWEINAGWSNFSSASTRRIIKTFSLSRQITSQRQTTTVVMSTRMTHSQTLTQINILHLICEIQRISFGRAVTKRNLVLWFSRTLEDDLLFLCPSSVQITRDCISESSFFVNECAGTCFLRAGNAENAIVFELKTI
jgi:hypothetical protein